jgi:hypothetical protein
MEFLMKLLFSLSIITMFLAGCGQSSLDACTDSKLYLWNPDIKGNQHEGNERYWDAIKACEN